MSQRWARFCFYCEWELWLIWKLNFSYSLRTCWVKAGESSSTALEGIKTSKGKPLSKQSTLGLQSARGRSSVSAHRLRIRQKTRDTAPRFPHSALTVLTRHRAKSLFTLANSKNLDLNQGHHRVRPKSRFTLLSDLLSLGHLSSQSWTHRFDNDT